MKCLNIKSPEFITLYNKTTVHPLKLLMMVNKYFSDNPDVEEMPTFKQLGLTAKDLKQSVTKVDEHLLSLMQDGFISYQNNEVEYKGAKYSKKGFLKNMYGLSVSDNAEGSIDPVAYFSLRKSTANNLLTALDGYISTQEELNQYFKTYVDNSPNVFDAIRNNDAFVEYVKGIIGEQKEKEQKVTSFNKNPNPVNIGAKFPKDQTKADYADSMIGFGEPNTSTAKYAARFGNKSNKGMYQKGETVFISVNGRGRANLASNLSKTKAEIDKAISQGVGRFVADNKDVANSSHNSVGEGVIRQYLLDKGMLYVEYDGIGFYVNNLQQQDSVKPVIDLSREWSGDLESSPVYTKGSVNTMRTKSAKPNEHFGNPWSKGGYSGTIETSSVAKAVQNYKDWLTTDKYDFDHPLKMMDDSEFNKFYTQIKKMSNSNNNNVQEQFANNYLLNLLNRKRWILDQINQGKLDGANLLYSKKLMDRGQGSHAIALAEIVEQLRSQQPQPQPQQKAKEFTYKNKTIETSFVLTQGQENALKRLVDFSEDRNGEKMITLQGAAGTGKTSVIGYLQKYLGSDYNFVYMAPTHAATAELAFATVPIGNTQLPMTVASAMKETKLKDGTKKIGPSKKLKGKLDFNNNIIVVDESSMLGQKNYDSLIEMLQGINAKIIFMGDIKQIPEVDVRNPKQKEVSDAFVKPEQVILTEVKRTESNSILSVLTSLRDNMDSKIPIVENSDELNFLKQNKYDEELVKTVKEDPEDTVVISYTNSSVQSYNKKIRKVLGREGNLKPGDIITGYIGYASKELEKGHIANSVRFKVDAVSKIGSVYRITAVSKKMSQLKKMGLKIPAWYNGNYFQLSLNDSFVFDDITSDDMKKNNDQISNLMKRLYEKKEYAKKSNRWKSFEELKKEVSDFFAVNLLGENYIYNPSTGKMELFNYSYHQNIKKQYPELYVEKGVDFGHAITIHKSQGSSIKNVFFDTDSLPEREGSTLVQGGNVVGNEKHSLIYVAMSRASKKLFVNLTNPAHFKSITQPVSQQPQQQQPQQPVTESKKPMSFGELMQLPQVNNRVNLYLKENPNMTVNEIINKLIIDGIINKDCTI